MNFDLSYKNLRCIKTFPNYLDHFQKDLFIMIKQFEPPPFFVKFIMGVNNWPIFMTTFKNLHTQHFNENIITNNDNSLNSKGLVTNHPITCVWFYERKMNNFCKSLKNINVLFNDVKDYFFIA